MPRVKRGTISTKRRRNTLKQAKGYRFGRSTKEKLAKEAISHAGRNAFRDRRNKKRSNRRLWSTKINAIVRENDLSYSKFIDKLKKNKIDLNRKVLAELAEKEPKLFEKILEEVK